MAVLLTLVPTGLVAEVTLAEDEAEGGEEGFAGDREEEAPPARLEGVRFFLAPGPGDDMRCTTGTVLSTLDCLLAAVGRSKRECPERARRVLGLGLGASLLLPFKLLAVVGCSRRDDSDTRVTCGTCGEAAAEDLEGGLPPPSSWSGWICIAPVPLAYVSLSPLPLLRRWAASLLKLAAVGAKTLLGGGSGCGVYGGG